MQQEVLQAILSKLQRCSELISAKCIALLTDSQFLQLISADKLNITSEMRVVEMLEDRLSALGSISSAATLVSQYMHAITLLHIMRTANNRQVASRRRQVLIFYAATHFVTTICCSVASLSATSSGNAGRAIGTHDHDGALLHASARRAMSENSGFDRIGTVLPQHIQGIEALSTKVGGYQIYRYDVPTFICGR